MKYVIDSFAWLEYFMGTEAGRKAREIVDSKGHEKLTPTICLAEVYSKILRTEDEEKAELRRAFIKSRSALTSLTEEIAVEAAKLDNVMKRRTQAWGLADSIVLSTARAKNARVLTKESHFRGLQDVDMI